MEKSKLKFNKLGKIGTLIPAIMMAGMINCAAETYKGAPNKASKYNEEKAVATMDKILNSDLNKMTSYDRLEAKVQNEIVECMTDMNINSLELANDYERFEHSIIKKSGKSTEELVKIAEKKGQNVIPSENALVVRVSTAHLSHMFLKSQALIRFRADNAEILEIDETDKKNELWREVVYKLNLNTNGPRSLLKESNSLLDITKNDCVVDSTLFGYRYKDIIEGKNNVKVNEKAAQQAANQINNNLTKIKNLVSSKNLSQKDYQSLLNLIEETAEILYKSDMFGDKTMCRGFIIEFTSSYAMNNLLTIVANLGYDVDNLEASYTKVSNSNITWDTSVVLDATNKPGINMGVGVTKPLTDNFSIGGKLNYKAPDNSFQVLTTGEIGTTTPKDNYISAGVTAGVQFDQKGISTPFGLNAGYSWQIGKNFSLDIGVSTLLNVQQASLDLTAPIRFKFKTKNGFNVIFSINAGHQLDLNQTNTTTTTTQQPTPVYGEEEVYTPGPGTTTDKGSIYDLPEISH